MVKEKPEVQEDKINETFSQKQKLGLAPQFIKKEDKVLNKPTVKQVSDEEREIVEKICPHYYTLKDRYAEYQNFDDEGKNPLPLRIDRVHELSAFEATLAQADLTKEFDVFPTRLIKVFNYTETGSKEVFLVVDKRVVGIDTQGRSTNISSVRTGFFKYPGQFEQDRDGDWKAVPSQMQKVYNIPFSKEKVLEFAHMGNPYIKKYVVWHPDGIRRGHFTLEEFINLSDQEQLDLIETGKR